MIFWLTAWILTVASAILFAFDRNDWSWIPLVCCIVCMAMAFGTIEWAW